MKLFVILVFVFILFGCASLESHPKDGLIEVRIQTLEKNDACTGKGVEAYSASKNGKSFSIKSSTIYVSPGTWRFFYFPIYELRTPEKCDEIQEMIIHAEFSVSGKLKKGNKYLLQLNSRNQAEFKVM